MAAIRPESNVFKCLAESGVAALHILDLSQQDMARRFFSPTKAVDGTINGEPFMPGVTRVPVLQNARAYCECAVRHIVETRGDHAVVILEVVEAQCRRELRPLTIAESPWEYGG
jgi:flavin reductase (DIM6/NTAB) family NADH-FMN oxidoreductase RutF